MKVFVAGSTGAIGRRLVPILLKNGITVAGSTRNPEKVDALKEIGVAPYLVDVYDAAALKSALAEFCPDVVIHQLTDLPPNLEPAQMLAGIKRNARIRRDGTQHLVDAAVAAGSKRIIAQSIAWAYAPGPEPHPESDPLDVNAAEPRSISVAGVVALEAAVLRAAGMTPIVLRYAQSMGLVREPRHLRKDYQFTSMRPHMLHFWRSPGAEPESTTLPSRMSPSPRQKRERISAGRQNIVLSRS